MSKSALVLAAMMTEPSSLISAAWARLRPERLLGHQVAKAGAVETVDRARLVEVVGHRQRRALQIAGVLLHIGVGDRQRRTDDRLGPDLEPAVEADVERDRGDDGDHDGRDGRDQREHGDDAHMQARRRLAAPRARHRCDGSRGRSARSASSTKPALTAISVSVVALSGVIGVTPTRMANETAALISAPTIASTPVSTSRRRPSVRRRLVQYAGAVSIVESVAISP